MKKLKKIFNSLVLSGLLIVPNIALADSGLDSNYKSSGSIIGGLINALFSLGEIIGAQPGSEDYEVSHVIIAVLCIITFLIVTAVYILKLGNKKKSKKEILIKLGISLIPTILFSLICFLTELQLILYIILLIVYVSILIISVKVVLKKQLAKEMNRLKELDKSFNEEEFANEAFNIYKEVQLAWCNFELDKVKELISEEMYNKYIEKLEELKEKKQQNVMNEIEYKSNKITNVRVDTNIEITCEMEVECYDYIIDDTESIVNGKKDKKINYKYALTFIKNTKNNKYVLVEKKLLKTKI